MRFESAIMNAPGSALVTRKRRKTVNTFALHFG